MESISEKIENLELYLSLISNSPIKNETEDQANLRFALEKDKYGKKLEDVVLEILQKSINYSKVERDKKKIYIFYPLEKRISSREPGDHFFIVNDNKYKSDDKFSMIYIEQKMYNPIKCITGSSYRNIDKASKIICEIYRDLRAPGESIPTWIRTVSALTSIFALSSIASYYRTEDITKSIVTGAMISLIPAFISITKKSRKIRTYKDYPFLVANHGFKSLYSMATELVEHKNDE